MTLTMYSTSWCGYCRRLEKALKAGGIDYTKVDIGADRQAAAFVASVNDGNETVPTVKFSDGSTMTNPNIAQVERKLAELG